jgi:hypothetical protein
MSVVLDTSAMVAYARGSVAVGELIVLVSEESAGRVNLPVVALAEAYGRVDEADHPMLGLLKAGERSVVAPLDPGAAAHVGVVGRRIGLGTAHAVSVIAISDGYLVTADLSSVKGLVDERLIIEI